MSSITQTIPNYNGGISQQPDELKVPGQVKDALNVLPDLTHGLLKRPGGRLIKSLSDEVTVANNSQTDGKWFHYYRDENEQYIGQIKRSDGSVRMWDCLTGDVKTVQYGGRPWQASTAYSVGATTQADSKVYECITAGTSASSGGPSGTNADITDGSVHWKYTNTISALTTQLQTYLTHTADADIQNLTLNDFTYLTNRNKTVAMAATIEPERLPEAYVELKKVAYASQYSVNVFDDTSTTTVYTATRVKIKRIVDSSNSCKDTSTVGSWPPSGTEPGSSGWQTVCDIASDGTADSYCPAVATDIFSITHGGAVASTDINGVTNRTYSVSANGGSASDRKNLYVRIVTTGQPVPQSNDSTPIYYCRYTTTYDLLYGGEGWRTGDTVDVWMNNARYTITIEAHSVSQVQANLALVRPEPTPFDTETTVTAESILGDIRTGIEDDSNEFEGSDGEIKQIGNGLYLKRNAAADVFNISTPVNELLNVLTDSVEDVADLPRQCKHGYVVRVSNSASEEDDYYLKFFGNNDSDGEGVWEECPEPGRKVELDRTTMPIQLVREGNKSFTVKHVVWDKCPVGDLTTTPEPSFVGYKVTKMLFWRNRLALLSDENINLSRPGAFFHFWPKTAITYTATDNIDISCSSEYPAIIYDGIQVNQGLVLFTKNQQFMVTTDSDILSPQTAKINSVATYNFNFNTNPISLGTTISFLDNAGKNSRFFEMSNVVREGAPEVIEQSKIVSKLFPKDITEIANSRENSVIFFGTKGSNEVFGYRYFSSIEKRIQNAWFRWKVSGDVQHMAMLDDALYLVIRNGTKDVLQKFSIKLDDSSNSLVNDLGTDTADDDLTYRLHLDNATTVAHTALTYVANGDYTKFAIPVGFNNAQANLHAIAVPTTADKTFQGMSAQAYTFSDSGTASIKLPGNWKTYDPQGVDDNITSDDVTPPGSIILGYTFDMEVKFPTIYYTQPTQTGFKSETQGSLVLHRLKFNFGPLGVYETKLERIGKPDYVELYEAVIADSYIANRVQFTPDSRATIPVYEKNTNLTLTLKSTHPSPATLYSMTWEGDYNNRYYKYV